MLFRVLAVAAAATAVVPLTVKAESIYQNAGPAELPPASFKGNQFVDSRGCIFMRAGYGNQTSWVPRVTRDRRVMCGYKPSFAPSQTRAVTGGGITTAVTLAKPKPMPLADVPPPKAVRIVPAPAKKPVATAASAQSGTPMTTIAGSARVAPPQPLRVAAAQKVYTAQSSGKYGLLSTAPQEGAPMAPPPGYKPAWTDGRLNPQRGPRTAEGDAEMNLVWTRTVPRRLVDTRSMKDVTARYPGLTYPKTAQPPQPTAGVRPVRVTLSTSNGGAARAAIPARMGARYIQVGLFGVLSNATRTVARLQAAGLPVRVAQIRSRGRVLRSVMAGPFASPTQLSAALATARRAGFGDAYIR